MGQVALFFGGIRLLNRTKIFRLPGRATVSRLWPWADKKAGLNQNFTPGYRWGSDTVAGHALSRSRMDDDLMNRTTYAGVAEGGIGRRGLRNSNPPGDFTNAAWCGRKTRRGTPCQCLGMANGRNGARFLLGRRPKKELAYPKANVRLGPFTSSRRGPRPPARPAEQFAAQRGD